MANILVCDDDKDIVEAIEIYLTQEGYHNLKAYDGQEALDILRKSYLNLGEVLPDASIKSKNDAYSAVIYEQDPLGETTVEGGTYVNLHITLEKDKIAALDSLMVTE